MRYMVEESSADIPWLPNWFFMDHMAELIDAYALVLASLIGTGRALTGVVAATERC